MGLFNKKIKPITGVIAPNDLKRDAIGKFYDPTKTESQTKSNDFTHLSRESKFFTAGLKNLRQRKLEDANAEQKTQR